MLRTAVLATLTAAVLCACKGDPSAPLPDATGSLDLAGQWHVSDSTLYDITNLSGVADGMRHIGAYVVTGNATLARVGGATWSAAMQVTITYIDSTAGAPARRTPQAVSFVNPIVILNDSIFGLAAGGEVIPPVAGPTASQIVWGYDGTSGQCQTMIAGFQPASVSCRQSVHWTR